MGWIIAIILVLLIGSRTIASTWIDYEWWCELGQVDVWVNMLLYRYGPVLGAAALIFGVVWIAQARGLKTGGAGLSQFPGYARISTIAIGIFSVLAALVTIDGWTVARFFGGRAAGASGWREPVFNQPLSFYFFELPFYRQLLGVILVTAIAAALAYFLTNRWALYRDRDLQQIEITSLTEILDSPFLRGIAAFGLLVLAARYFLDRYDILFADHGLLVGADWVAERVDLPFYYALIGACVLGAALMLMGKWGFAVAIVVVLNLASAVVPRLVSAFYVKPSEITIQKPYVTRHIEATSAAYGLASDKVREVEFPVKLDAGFNPAQYRTHLEQVRLWDRTAYHDAVAQLQALRPYYNFTDTDVDRYWIPDEKGEKQIKHVLMTARELDVRQVPEARSRWNNPHFVYTHGYGLVLSEASRQTPDGMPEFLIKNAPPEIGKPWFKLTRPEIYYGEVVHEPVFVRTKQPEFNYPSGSENVHSSYAGKGGIPIGNFPLKLAAAIANSDWNIIFTQFMTSESRMMIRRRVADRVDELAPFIQWDSDPYLVITDAGRLVWMIDGFTTSGDYPYAKSIRRFNYIRNSVKATVDAYDGNVKMYVFDEADPIIRAYRALFPTLFSKQSEMPADLRAHARYPEPIFRIQAEIYRTYHMRDPEAFYNKEDLWDITNTTYEQQGEVQQATPRYIVGTVPGSMKPEFLLTLPFAPRNKQNLVGLMMARSDGEHLGELVVLEMSKQELIYGPMQVKARINQDQTISKDLTLWNQQGSKVIRGQLVVLPIDQNFLYIEPIYLQAAQAPMPQLRKVAIAMGNQLAYADTYEQALEQIGAGAASRGAPRELTAAQTAAGAKREPGSAPPIAAPLVEEARKLENIRNRLRRYRELVAQGKMAEAGRELEAVQELVGRD